MSSINYAPQLDALTTVIECGAHRNIKAVIACGGCVAFGCIFLHVRRVCAVIIQSVDISTRPTLCMGGLQVVEAKLPRRKVIYRFHWSLLTVISNQNDARVGLLAVYTPHYTRRCDSMLVIYIYTVPRNVGNFHLSGSSSSSFINLTVKNTWKLVLNCRSYRRNKSALLFWDKKQYGAIFADSRISDFHIECSGRGLMGDDRGLCIRPSCLPQTVVDGSPQRDHTGTETRRGSGANSVIMPL